MEFIAAVILAHLVGDYVIQSDWMAQKKTSQWLPAILHGITYTLPYLFITLSPLALIVIAGTHIIIDRYRLAKYLVWAKNQLAPKSFRYPWKPKPMPTPVMKMPAETVTGTISAEKLRAESTRIPIFIHSDQANMVSVRDTSKDNNPATGYRKNIPDWMGVWLMIIADNCAHILIGVAAVIWL